MTIWKANESVHGHTCQRAHEELAPHGVRTANKHHLRMERSEVGLWIFHSRERHLRTHESVRDHCLHDRLREWHRKLPRWRETLAILCFTIPRVVAQPAAQLFVRATQLFIPCLRRRKIHLNALLLCLRHHHRLLKALHHLHDLLQGHVISLCARR